MPEPYHQLIQNYTKAKEAGYAKGLIAYLRENNPNIFAHHPASPLFRDHVWHFRGFHLCKGCVLSSSGILAGFLLYALTHWLDSLNTADTALTFSLMLVPTIIGACWQLPKAIRYPSRFLLGMLTASAFLFLFITRDHFAQLTVIGVFILARFFLGKYRNKMNRKLQTEGSSP